MNNTNPLYSCSLHAAPDKSEQGLKDFSKAWFDIVLYLMGYTYNNEHFVCTIDSSFAKFYVLKQYADLYKEKYANA